MRPSDSAVQMETGDTDALLPAPATTSSGTHTPALRRLYRHAKHLVQLDSPVFLVAMYFLLNLGITIYNKVILKFFHFNFPWLLTAIHSLLSYAGCFLAFKVFKSSSPTIPLTSRKDQLAVLLFSFLYTINIAVSNISLNIVSLPFHQIVRSTNPAVTIAMEYVLLAKWRNGVGMDVFMSLFVVIFGVGLATLGDYEFTLLGFLITFLGTILSSLKGISTNILLAGNGLTFPPLELLYRMSGLSFLQCLAISYSTGELARFATLMATLQQGRVEAGVEGHGVIVWLNPVWLVLALGVNGTMAFWLNFVSFSANKKVGALSIAVAGNVKQAMSLGLSVWIFGYVISAVNGVGILLTLGGGAWYSMIGVAKKAKQ
ncbi:UAA transporter [Podochytrium sp. JEL0797]|nr:UAA transporter [Podochytrium sp. JEL0797]